MAETSLADIVWILDGITTLEKSLALIEDFARNVKLGRIARVEGTLVPLVRERKMFPIEFITNLYAFQ